MSNFMRMMKNLKYRMIFCKYFYWRRFNKMSCNLIKSRIIKKRLGEMAEWSNAVDSKSIVRFTAYLGFESLSHRHLQQPRESGVLL